MEDIPEQLRLLPRAIDFRAEKTPNRTFVYLPKGDQIEDGFFEFTYSALAKAVDAMAWWLDENFTEQDKTVPYIGANDIRYGLVVFAAIKTGRAAMIPLLYNTPEGQAKLLNSYSCKAVVADAGYETYWRGSLDTIPGLRLVQMPSCNEFLNAATKPYVFEKSASDAKNDATVILQTSGTTGNPKPLHWGNGLLNMMNDTMTWSKASPPDEKSSFEACLSQCWTPNMLPLNWGLGLFNLILFPLVSENITVMFPASVPQPVTPEYAHRMIQSGPRGPYNGAIFVPDTLNGIAQNPTYLNSLKHYSWVGYAGAPLDHNVGDVIARQGTRVQSMIGQMDCGAYPTLVSHLDDWEMFRLKEVHGYHFREFSEDSWELCIKKQPEENRPGFLLNGGEEIYHTKDLWKKVPGREGYWIMSGRVDDFVKLSNMTKFNAIAMEGIIERHPGVEKVLVAGDARKRAFVLLQPTTELRASCNNDDEKIVQAVWSQLQEVNRQVHSDAWLTKELVFVTHADRPIERTAKGTAQRRSTLMAYQNEIETLYTRLAVTA